MANPLLKHKSNVDGPYYCTDPEDAKGEGCIACCRCYTEAPNFYAQDEQGNAFVKFQPHTPEEVDAVEAAMAVCPVDSIGRDGGEE